MKHITHALLILFTLLLAACYFAGCTTAINARYVTAISNKGFGIDVESANQGNGTPTVKLGFFSSRVMFIPTSTNGAVEAPRVMDAFSSKSSANPFDVNLTDNFGSGDVYIGGTNDTSKAIIPSTYSLFPGPSPFSTKTNSP
jgi:hypothetical protein